MKRSLSELICDDLSELAHLESDVVVSEEAIRTMVQIDKDKGLLSNHSFVHKDKLQALLNKKMQDETFLNTPAHYQFFVEVGTRSKVEQGAPATIHYCPLDLYIRPGKKPLAFVADHYRGHKGYYIEYKEISEKLGIQFIVVGGSHYQVDDAHCAIFAHKHLQLSATDRRLLPLLEHIVGEKEGTIEFNWNQLPPEYLVYSQSVSMLLQYVDSVKASEGVSKELPSKALISSQFPENLYRSLFRYEGKGPEDADRNKIRNKGVKYLAADLAGKVVVELEKAKPAYTEAQLIDICYKDSYPLVHEILHQALKVQNQQPVFDKSKLEAHPLFELAFSHAVILESCLKNPKFNKIFTNQTLLVLMQQGLIDPQKLFAKLTMTYNEKQIAKVPCNQAAANLVSFELLVKVCFNNTKVTEEELLTLLLSPKIIPFSKNKILVDLLAQKLIPIQMIEKILPHQIDKITFEHMDNGNRVKYLHDKFPLIGSAKVELASEDEDGPSEDIFSIPDSSISAKPSDDAGDKEKPVVDVGLLIQSMSKSVFTSVPESPLQEKVDLSLTVV